MSLEHTQTDGWYVSRGGKKLGPYTTSILNEAVLKGVVTIDDFVWRPGWDNWRLAGTVPELFKPPALIELPGKSTTKAPDLPEAAPEANGTLKSSIQDSPYYKPACALAALSFLPWSVFWYALISGGDIPASSAALLASLLALPSSALAIVPLDLGLRFHSLLERRRAKKHPHTRGGRWLT